MSEQQPNNPLHGVKLVDILQFLVNELGWEKMADEIPVRCFQFDPSIKSSLVFLRRTPWARDKVEALYLDITNNTPRASADKKSHGKYNIRRK
jgi:uncharacterized protein (DUF2132 family)